MEPGDTQSPEEPIQDLGFGRVLVQQVRGRFMRKDGTPNSRKYGLGGQFWQRLYLRALAATWASFLLWLAGLVLLANGIFALGYSSMGPGALAGAEALGLTDPFFQAFCFSVGVFTTVGTGPMHAVGVTANWLVAMESLAGVMSLVTAGGLVLARLARPRAQIRFSHSAAIAPYREGRGFMFRIVNLDPSELIDVDARVNLAWFEERGGKRERRFHQLTLERRQVEFFSLHWTVVHPITADSPLAGVTPELLRRAEAEFLVLITGLEETFSTRITARASYLWDEVRWDARFADMFVPSPDGVITVDVERLDRLDRLAEGATTTPSASEAPGARTMRRA
jgi:inward rectifier potassium channel